MDAGVAGILSLFLILSIICFMLWKNNQKRGQLPPGPAPWFLLGNLWQKDILPLHKSYQKLRKKYGPVFTIWLGPKPAVVLCGYEAVRDAFVGHAEEFGGRAAIAIHERVTDGYGLITGSEKKQRELRRFTIATLRDFGMGKKTMAQRVQEEAQYLVEAVADMEGEAFDPMSRIRHAVSNVVCAVVFGSRFSYEDKAFLELLGMMGNYSYYFMSPFARVYNTFPGIMCYLPGPHNKVFTESEKLKNFIRKRIDSHKRNLDPSCPRDYIDCFLIKSEKGTSTSGDVFSSENLLMAVFDLFGAGTVSTANTLLFFLLVMAKFPQIQARVQQEIEKVVGAIHAPGMEDRVRMPYTNAVIHEMQRSQSGQMENFPRAVTRRIEFQGYTIPQVYNTFPGIMCYLPGPHNKVFTESEKLKNFIRKRIDSHKRNLDPSCPRDYIDCFLIKSEKGTSTSGDVFSSENLLMAVFDLFGAGTVSTANTLLFFLLVMAKFPQIQGCFSADNQVNPLPYLMSAFPVSFYPISLQGTAVIPVFRSVHSDPKYWETPEEFNPGHFLDEKGKFRPNEAFMPFSVGKRMCPGEGLARMELFLFFSTLLQNFTFKLATDPQEMDILSLWMDYLNKGPYSKFHVIRR
ncbi:Cytochrome P450 2G1 [Chelonia mydas]|uniref:Cytochrome P450 2G1 n=1 Tax=Chelonia mydas TaxID=8469 RepID=M7AHC4_CHEMY|nr:Cytochrome P450 2G1 [Chelonia mydas]